MPSLEITADKTPADLDAFLKNLSAVFSECIGKPEAYCMVIFTKADRIYYNGSSGASFLAKVTSIGNIDNDRNANLSKKIGAELEKELGVTLDRGYFFFSDAKASDTGYKGNTFANLMGL
ncbi:Tautomerase/MIF superfamily [Zychaea mexicana]|uniref:Tautomerase/MIF superfamily n=1 Tax=Zychaea mexicana TaxID=64656 RepID=UPI0022FF24C8|nr:Tautomerase/MIF superfamily [Zychaea mexicana]KAI9490701.1 Tautomerase/MIF superfamily [Zychaea mexicana]